MSSPIRLFCRTCEKDALSPDGMTYEQMQEYFNIRHELAVVRERWPGYKYTPAIDYDHNEEATHFLCEHKDHDLCMTDACDWDKVVEFKWKGRVCGATSANQE